MSVDAGQLSGALALAQLPAGLLTNDSTGVNLSGSFAGNGALAGTFSGDGAGLSNVNASLLSGQPGSYYQNAANLTAGTLPLAALPGAVLTNNANGVTLNGSFTGNGAGLTGVPGTISWQSVTGTNQQAQPNTGYLATNAAQVTITLPTAPNVGDIVSVSGVGAGGWQVLQNVVSYTNRFLFTGAKTNITLPAGIYSITAYGAQGGPGDSYGISGGLGAEMEGEFCFFAPTTLTLLVGGVGTNPWNASGGGGGGSFVVNGATPLVVAGGGGGGGVIANGGAGVITSSGGNGDGSGYFYGYGYGFGGSGGGGGLAGFEGGSGGGGYSGGGGDSGSMEGGGQSYLGGGLGGGEGAGNGGIGGYGGGGSGYWGSGGGGGGYSGGGGGANVDVDFNNVFGGGGGGGSIIDSSAVAIGTELAGVQSGNGEIDIVPVVLAHFTGGPNSAIQLQYVGNGQWQPLNFSGNITVATSALSITSLAQLPSAVVTNQESGVTLSGTFSGNGNGLSSLNASQLTGGTVPLAQLPSAVVTNQESGVTLSGTFSGNGNGLSSLNASQLTGGTVPLAQLPSAVVTNQESGVTLSGTFSGNGNGLSSLNASQLTGGTVPLAQLPSAVVTNNRSGVTLSGTFTGNGAGLTSLNASQLSTGTLPLAQLPSAVVTNNESGVTLSALSLNGITSLSGNVGIGTTTPAFPLDVQASALYNTSYGFLNPGGNVGTGSGNNPYSIRASQRILATEFNAYSDQRGKQIVARSDTRNDLNVIRQLQVTDYHLIDAVANGRELKKGFIAQEVKGVAPEAVTPSPNFVPNIYALATATEFDANRKTLSVSLAQAHGLVVGDKVRLYTGSGPVERLVTGVPSDHQFVVSGWDTAPDRVFVYGKYITDYLTLDYNRLFTTGVGAIQELAKQADAREARTTELERELAELKAQVAKLLEALPQGN